ncbi:M12 family metallopeptidase [Aquimarina agarilytica]|uniref:M12 family metallopeptidase n=1 Tax=Aquimarina agarilytica TaxID=1087449 RepID=UPI000289702F|nr:M12 family metallopeptidase [Aquimarina agarilytica]
MKLTKLATITAAVLSLWSCQTEDTNVNNDDTTLQGQTEIRSLMGIKNFPVVKQPDGSFLHGDVILEESNFDDPNAPDILEPQTPEKGALTLGNGYVRKWPNNTVVFRYDNSMTSQMRSTFQQAMDEWKNKTNVRFKERTNEADFVTVKSTGDDCFCGYATLGQARNRGVLAVGTRAPLSVVMHEIGHTLGFLHEQNRSDRDAYVKINFQNISRGAEDQFYKSDNSINLTDKLDLQSIMMYGSYTFSANRQPTIVDLNGNTYRKTGRLSEGDIKGTNKAYPGNSTGGDDTTDEDEDEDDDTTDEDEDEDDDTTDEDEDEDDDVKDPKDVCSGVAEWKRNGTYSVGDRVTYKGYLFERDFSNWSFIKKCGVTVEKDICAGIDRYNGGRYNVGDQVVFRGYLYTRVQGGWIREGQCGR